MRKAKVNIDNESLSEAASLLRAINHKLRMEILLYIDQNDKINVNKIYNTLNLEQSITSQHLRILRMAGIVETQRDGKFIFYTINYDKLDKAVKAVEKFVNE